MTSCEGSGPSPEDMAEGTNLPWTFEFSYGEDLDSGRVGLTMQTDAQLFQDMLAGNALDHFDDISATPMLFTPLTLMKMKVDNLLEPVSLKSAVIDEMVQLKDLAATADDDDWLSDMLGAGAAKADNHRKANAAEAAKGPSGHGPKPKKAKSAEPLHAHCDDDDLGSDDDELLPEPAKALLEAYHHEVALDDLNCVGMEECASLASDDTSSDSMTLSSDQEGSQDSQDGGAPPPPPPPPHPAAAGRARGKGRGRGRGRGRPSAAAAAAGAEPDARVGVAPAAKAKAKGKANQFRDDAAQVICLPSANRQLAAYGLRSFGEVGFGGCQRVGELELRGWIGWMLDAGGWRLRAGEWGVARRSEE